MKLPDKMTQIFCSVDDFCCIFEPWFRGKLLTEGKVKRVRNSSLSMSEVMTIVVSFHASDFKNLKSFYNYLCTFYRHLFPGLVSYSRFVRLQQSASFPLWAFLNSHYAEPTGIAFVDSTKIAVCGNKRITRNKVFDDVAKLGKSTMGWFFGFKLHLIINEYGEILSCSVTKGNVDDRAPVPHMVKNIFGYLFGDKGYIGEEFAQKLQNQGVKMVTQVRKNMKKKELSNYEQIMLRKRSVIETVNDQLKNISQIEHTRHRSIANFITNLFAGIVAYTFREKKPSIKFNFSIENAKQLIVC